ncbi:MAG: hypothetical protein IT381_26215 [Deltaproteobacteria bacterium]|nr:hypothetical protein [Deltaproteobacteria bacterium]
MIAMTPLLLALVLGDISESTSLPGAQPERGRWSVLGGGSLERGWALSLQAHASALDVTHGIAGAEAMAFRSLHGRVDLGFGLRLGGPTGYLVHTVGPVRILAISPLLTLRWRFFDHGASCMSAQMRLAWSYLVAAPVLPLFNVELSWMTSTFFGTHEMYAGVIAQYEVLSGLSLGGRFGFMFTLSANGHAALFVQHDVGVSLTNTAAGRLPFIRGMIGVVWRI